jgi:hypothetical protein
MPERLHYVEYFFNKPRDEFLTTLAHDYPLTLLLWLALTALLCFSYLWAKRRRKTLQPSAALPSPRLPRAGAKILVPLFLASLALNLFRIDQESLSTMEGTYLSEAATNSSLLGALLNWNGLINSHFPLYRLFIHLALHLSDSVVYLRALSAVFGALAIPIWYLFARRFFPDSTALLSAILFMVSPLQIYFSQSIMPYSMLALLVMLHYYSFVLISENPSRKNTLAYATAVALGLNVHALFFGMLLPPFLYQLSRYLRHRDKEQTGYLFFAYLEKTFLAGFFFLPFVLIELSVMTFFSRDFTGYMASIEIFHPISEISPVSALFLARLGNALVGLDTHSPAVAWAAALLFVSASLLLLFFRGLGTFLLVAGPCYCLLLMQYAHFLYIEHLNFEIRYWCFAPAFFWATILGALATLLRRRALAARIPILFGRRRAARALVALGILCALPSLATLFSLYTRLDNPDIRSAAHFLRDRLEDGDALCVTPASFFADVLLFHLHEPWDDFKRWDSRINTLQLNRIPRGDGFVEYFGSISNRFLPWEEASRNLFFERIWLVDIEEATLGYPEYSDKPSRRVKTYYDAAFELEETQRFQRVNLSLYKTRYAIPGLSSGTFVLRLGKDDYPYLEGFAPPATYPSASRTLTPRSRVRIPIENGRSGSGSRLKVTIAFRPGTRSCGNKVLRLAYLLNERPVYREHRYTDEPEQHIEDILGFDAGGASLLEIVFEPDSLSNPEAPCIPDLTLEAIELERLPR